MGDVIKELYRKAGVRLYGVYPLVLSDKQQLDLLKVLIKGRWIEFAQYVGELGKTKYYAGKIDFKAHFEAEEFEEMLAGMVLRLWVNLSDTDKNRVQEILRGEE